VLNGQPYAWPVPVGPAGLAPGCSYIFRVDAVNAVGGCPGLPSKPFALSRSAAELDAPLVSAVPPPEPISCRVRVVLMVLLSHVGFASPHVVRCFSSVCLSSSAAVPSSLSCRLLPLNPQFPASPSPEHTRHGRKCDPHPLYRVCRAIVDCSMNSPLVSCVPCYR
jgi:hypothetical protein